MDEYLLKGIIIIGIIIFVFSLFQHKKEVVVNFVLRVLLGGLGIYCINTIMLEQGLKSGVGMGGVSLLTIGILGLPGFFLLYGITSYHLLK